MVEQLFGACKIFLCFGGLAGREQVKVALGWGSRVMDQTHRETTRSHQSHFHQLLLWEVTLGMPVQRGGT